MRDFAAEVTPLVLTRDEEPNIARTLAQLAWAREVIMVDSMSGDATVAIAKSFPHVRVVQRTFDDLASQWNFALAQASTEWVLTLDADYYVPPDFVRELGTLEPPPNVSAYEATFRYAVGGRPLRASLYPPRAVVLRRDRCTNFMDGHTQRVRVDGDTLPLRTPLIHDDRKPMSRFIERQRRYMRDEAVKLRRGESLNFASRIRKLRIVAPFAVVVHALFVKGLILDGRAGLRYAWERFIAEVILSRELSVGAGAPPAQAAEAAASTSDKSGGPPRP
jgi:glycosyltransferase involved in cell wall biosynthesis